MLCEWMYISEVADLHRVDEFLALLRINIFAFLLLEAGYLLNRRVLIFLLFCLPVIFFLNTMRRKGILQLLTLDETVFRKLNGLIEIY